MFYINEIYTFIGLALDYNWKQRIKKANEDRIRVYNFFQLLERMYVLKKKEMNEIVTKIIPIVKRAWDYCMERNVEGSLSPPNKGVN